MKKVVSFFLLLLTAAIWGFAFIAQKASAEIPTFTITALRSIIAALFLFALIPLTDRLQKNGRRFFSRAKILDISRTELIGGILCGVILAVATALQQYGLACGTDAGKGAFISSLYVVSVPVLGLLLRRRPPATVWISVCAAIAGFYLLSVKADFSVVPSDFIMLASSVMFAIHILTVGHFSPRCDGFRMSCVQFFAGAFLSAVIALFTERGAAPLSVIGENLLPILYLGLLSSAGAYTLQILAQKNSDPAVAAIVLSLESVFGVIGGMLFFHETMNAREYAGCAVVLLAVILAQLDIPSMLRRRKKAPQDTGDPS